jgi:penicillin-binding protein 1A
LNSVSSLHSSEGIKTAEIYTEKRYHSEPEEIPLKLKQAFLASEDQRFFEHSGIDLFGIIRAMITNLLALEIREGGSTITQQIARSFTGREKTFSRKIREAILARRIEDLYTKDQILLLYMNMIYLGHGSYGVKAAAWNYFRKEMKDLNLSETALLAILPQAPAKINPFVDFEGSAEKMKRVIKRMKEMGFIKSDEKADLKEVKVFPIMDYVGNRSPYLTVKIKEEKPEVSDVINPRRTVTTMNLGLQLTAEKALNRGLSDLDRKQGYRGTYGILPENRVKEFLKKSAEYYLQRDGIQGIPVQGNIYLAVVEQADKKGMSVNVTPEIKGFIPFEKMKWAGKYTEFPLIHVRMKKIKGKTAVEEYDNEGKLLKQITNVKDMNEEEENIAENLKEGEIKEFDFRRPLNEVSFNVSPDEPEAVFPRNSVILVKSEEGSREGSYIFSLWQIPKAEGSVVILDPHTGYILAEVGGKDFDTSQLNRAYSLRQTGSAFKPVYYSKLYDAGIAPSSVWSGSPFREGSYRLSEKPARDMTAWDGLTHSENNISLRIQRFVSSDVAKSEYEEWAKRFGLKNPVTGYASEALGVDQTLMDMTEAFEIFADNGSRKTGILVKTVSDSKGNIIIENRHFSDNSLSPAETVISVFRDIFNPDERAITEEINFMISQNLMQVIQRGTGKNARKYGGFAAGKTGTLPYDVWFIGFSNDLVTGVWIGMDNRERYLGKSKKDSKVFGANTALPVWLDIMENMHEEKKPFVQKVPEGINNIPVERDTGLKIENVEQVRITGKKQKTDDTVLYIPHLEGTEPDLKKSCQIQPSMIDYYLFEF